MVPTLVLASLGFPYPEDERLKEVVDPIGDVLPVPVGYVEIRFRSSGLNHIIEIQERQSIGPHRSCSTALGWVLSSWRRRSPRASQHRGLHHQGGVWGHSPLSFEWSVSFSSIYTPRGDWFASQHPLLIRNIMDKRFRFNQSISRETVKIPVSSSFEVMINSLSGSAAP